MNAHVIMHPAEQKRQTRRQLTKAANKLCALLDKIIAEMDAIDDDPDSEPSLGSVGAAMCNPWAIVPDWAQGANDDREDGHDGREPDEADGEPSLGSPEGLINQGRWGSSSTSDLEYQCEDEDFDSDTEARAY